MSRLITGALCALAALAALPASAQTWSFNAGAEGWTNISGGNLAGVSASGGSLNLTFNGAGDPHIGSLEGNTISAAASHQFGININFAPQAGGADSMQIFFDNNPAAGRQYSEAQSVSVPIQPGDNMYWIDMRTNPLWTGTIDNIRIDPGGNGANLGNGTMQIDWIFFGAGIDQQFNRSGDTEGWSASNHLTSVTANGSNLIANFAGQTGGDPFMSIAPTFWNSSTHRYIKIRQNATGRASNDTTLGEIHGFPGTGGGFVRDEFFYHPNNGYSTVVVDVSSPVGGSPGGNSWLGEGVVTSWRIDNTTDVLTGWQPSGQIAYDYITWTNSPVTTAGPYTWNFSGSGPGTWVAPKQTPFSGSALNTSGGFGTVTGSGTLALMNTDLVLDVAHRFLVLDLNVTTTVARNNFIVNFYWQNDGRPFESARFRQYTIGTNIGSNRYVFDLNTVGAGAGTYNGFPHGLLLQLGQGEAGVTSIAVDNIELRSAAAPQITFINDQTIGDNGAFTTTPTLVAGSGITWSKQGGPAALTVNSSTGQVTWNTPTVSQSPATVTIRATNAQGSDDETFVLTVADQTPPVITRNGAASVTHECGTAYSDLGAAATDNVNGTITGSIVVTNPVNASSQPGTYTVRYNVMDSAGNAAAEVTRTVTVQDTQVPAITLTGGTVTLECGSAYVEPGFTATDSCNGNRTANVLVTGTVNTAAPATYTLFYNVSDTTGNNAVQRTRTVIVEDTTDPGLTLVGPASVTVQCGQAYVDQGANVSDGCDTNISVVTNNPVDTAVPDDYTVTYTATDDSGNVSQITRSVTVEDTTPPLIALNGAASVNVQCGGTYTDAGATVSDGCDLGVSLNTTNPVNTAVPNTYIVTYSATDAAGNNAQVTRTVVVQDTLDPVITMNGDEAIVVECGGVYNDPGATASDQCDGDLTAEINTTNTVNTAIKSLQVVTYEVDDAAGNEALMQLRAVNVVDTTPPVITRNGPANVTVVVGQGYTDQGATANDACDGSVTVTTTNPVNPNMVGVYTVRYNADDSEGLDATEVTRTVSVIAGNAPVITLNGSASVQVQCGSVYNDAGATATDVEDGNVTGIISNSNVNTNTPGTYQVTYNVTDSSGNPATEVVRTVNVIDTVVPVLTLVGVGSLTVNCGAGYADPGASASDTCGGNLTPSVVVSETITASTPPGTYVIEYDVTDAHSNDATTISRTVTVLDNCPLSVSAVGDTDVDAQPGDDVSLTVEADGVIGTPAYQWLHQGQAKAFAPIPGANGPTLLLEDVGYDDDGQYICEVSDDVTVELSPLFTVSLPVLGLPLAGGLGLAAMGIATALAGLGALRRKK